MYAGRLFEKVTAGSVVDYRHYIYAGNELVGVLSRSGTSATLRYTLSDHQGSMDKITDSSGAITVSENFNAFGARRNASTWSGSPTSTDLTTINGISRQGYTGQDTLGNLGLNHMNGRVQDAITGRFLSADPYITEPGNTQNYNRYSYVYNNPLSYTDPSGFGVNECTMVNAKYESCMDKFYKEQYGSNYAVLQEVKVTAVLKLEEIPITAVRPGPDWWDLMQFFGNMVRNVFDKPVQPGPTGPQSQNPVKDWLCHAGNYVADVADKLGNVSGKLEMAGLGVALAGTVTAQPEVAAPGLALAATGGAGNIGASSLQFSAGLLQGAGGGGYGNSGYAAASLITGAALSRGILGPSTSVYRTVSQRASDGFRNGTATVVGGVNDLYTSWIDAAAPKQVTCPGGN